MRCTPRLWQQLDRANAFFKIYKSANKLTSGKQMPMSAYLPIVQAMANELTAVLNETNAGDFDTVFGAGAKAEIVSINRARFNMNGVPPPGSRVGFLDQYQIWAHLADPFRHHLQPAVYIAQEASQVTYMIDFFIRGDTEADDELRQELKLSYMAYNTRSYDPTNDLNWADFFDKPRPAAFPTAASQQGLTLENVHNWVKNTNHHNARLGFFNWPELQECKLYTKIFKKLLSMRTEASISVERVAKPLKHAVLTKKRNKLVVNKAAVFLRAGINLRFNYRHKTTMRLSAKRKVAAVANADNEIDLS